MINAQVAMTKEVVFRKNLFENKRKKTFNAYSNDVLLRKKK